MTSMVWMCEQHCVAATDFSLSGQQTILCVRLSSSNMLETFFYFYFPWARIISRCFIFILHNKLPQYRLP